MKCYFYLEDDYELTVADRCGVSIIAKGFFCARKKGHLGPHVSCLSHCKPENCKSLPNIKISFYKDQTLKLKFKKK